MKLLIFELFTVAILLCNLPEHVVGQNGQVNGKAQSHSIEMNSQRAVGKKSPLYIMSNIDKETEFRKTRLTYRENAESLNSNVLHVISTDPSGHYVQGSGSITTSTFNSYPELPFELQPESSTNKLELVRKLDPQLYQLNLKSLTPSAYARKNEFRIAEQLLLILLQEKQRKLQQ